MAGKDIIVYDDFSFDHPVIMGLLHVDVIRGGESYSFEYNSDWLLDTGYSVYLDPDIMPFAGRQYPSGKTIFGLFADSSPDRWGRTLMNRRERILAERENRKPRKLYESDYLLGVSDETRMGGIRFKLEEDGSFISDDREISVPPWTTLRTLEEASRKFESDQSAANDRWIRQLIKPGSSLGGARPKASVADTDGSLWIAKFPSRHDENDTGAWEKVAYDLAGLCGINVSESRLDRFSGLGSTFLVKRFDRACSRRVHFESAMTLLGKTDGASSADGTSYLDIAGFIRANGARPREDLIELWKRIVFSMSISNTDDHLRNHAFIYDRNGWILSPAFDINPTPYGNELSLNVDEYSNVIDINLAIEAAPRYGVSKADAKSYASEICRVVRENWRRIASGYGLSRAQIENMRPAFEQSENQ